MHRTFLIISTFLIAASTHAQDRETLILSQNCYDLADSGRTFLVSEAKRADFFMLGELHGENEIPQLLSSTWPELYNNGYHHIAAEVSEWAAGKLEFPRGTDSLKLEGLWTNREARFVHATAHKRTEKVLWGCDLEEISLGDLIKEFFLKKPAGKTSREILNTIGDGYNRKLAPRVLALMKDIDTMRGNEVYESILISLRIDSARAFPESRFKAQLLREELMKRSFVNNYNHDARSKVFLRFGRNHLHYGFDERGISTLGNFVAEFAISKDLRCFSVAAFAAGGECKLAGNTFSADERADDPAFQFLYEKAVYPTTIFDLRQLRVYLHSIPSAKRSELQQRLSYWADSYDAILCFKTVTPRK
jgi:hypothetical protein